MARNVVGRPATMAGRGGGTVPLPEGGARTMTRADLAYELDTAPPEVKLARELVKRGKKLTPQQFEICRTYFISVARSVKQ